MTDEFIHYSHSIGNNLHHLEWCTKYRYKIFAKNHTRETLRQLIYIACNQYHIKPIELSILPDHVHLIAQLHPTMSQSKAIQLLKGFTSYMLFKTIPNLRLRYPKGNLWSRGNFKDSIGRITSEAAKKYVREQNHVYQMSLGDFSFI